MKFLGLNSPEIFLISVIILSILGTKRIEKGWFLLQKFLKFLLSDEKNPSQEKKFLKEENALKVKESKESEVKEDLKVEVKEVKESKESEVKEDLKGEVKEVKESK